MPDRCRARKTVAVVIKRRLWGSITEYKCVSPGMMWVELKVAGEKIVIVGVYGPGMERSENERDTFWEYFDECMTGFSENERILFLGDMDTKVGNREVYKVVGKYSVPGLNENGERLVEVCSKMRLSIGNTWFAKRLIQKYTKEDENEQERRLIDYVLVEEKSKNL